MSAQAPSALALLTPEQIRALVSEAVATALAEHQPVASPRLLDRQALAETLGCSLPTLDKLRAEGMPELRLGDAPRFERQAVLEWLRTRSQQQKGR